MPNHCHNRVTFYSDDTTAILKLHRIFLQGIENDDDSETRKTVLVNSSPNQTGLKFHLLRKMLKSIHSVNQEVKWVNCLKCLMNLAKVYIFRPVGCKTTDGITGECITGELSGIAIP